MTSEPQSAFATRDVDAPAKEIARLVQSASVEVNVQDEGALKRSRRWLAEGTRLYISHLPGQTWEATGAMCRAVRRAGFEPVPHLPVRLIQSADQLEHVLNALAWPARPQAILLIAGDYPSAVGPYSQVAQVLATGALERYGFSAVSIAGHPEGHTKVASDEIRRAELEKPRLAAEHGLKSTILTQFLFEPEPFMHWVRDLRASGVGARLVCGLTGPAKVTTLVRYALRCGVGPSIRALGAHASSLKSLLGDDGPDRMIRSLAQSRLAGQCDFDGIHIFCFGGFLRTVEWMGAVAAGNFILNDRGGFNAS
jgi:methylenetetrahydrofolate reductase (NADPH)